MAESTRRTRSPQASTNDASKTTLYLSISSSLCVAIFLSVVMPSINLSTECAFLKADGYDRLNSSKQLSRAFSESQRWSRSVTKPSVSIVRAVRLTEAGKAQNGRGFVDVRFFFNFSYIFLDFEIC